MLCCVLQAISVGSEVVSSMCVEIEQWAQRVGKAKNTSQLVLLPEVCVHTHTHTYTHTHTLPLYPRHLSVSAPRDPSHLLLAGDNTHTHTHTHTHTDTRVQCMATFA